MSLKWKPVTRKTAAVITGGAVVGAGGFAVGGAANASLEPQDAPLVEFGSAGSSVGAPIRLKQKGVSWYVANGVDSDFFSTDSPFDASSGRFDSPSSPASPDSPDSPDSPASPDSPDSPDSPASPNSPDSPDSPASPPSAGSGGSWSGSSGGSS